MQIGLFVVLYRFLNQCFGNLAPGIVTFVSAYMQNFMPISATINKRQTYCLFTAEITVQIYMQHKIKWQLSLNQMNELNHNSYSKLPSFI